jgi:hypothetical protein
MAKYNDGLNSQGLIPERGKIFLLSTVYRPALGLTKPLILWVNMG